MLVTRQELIDLKAPCGALGRFLEQTNYTDEPVNVASLVGELVTYNDLLWLMSKKLPKERIVRFACDCALLVVDKIKPHVDGKEYLSVVDFLREPDTCSAVATYKVVQSTRIADHVIRGATRTTYGTCIECIAEYAAGCAARTEFALGSAVAVNDLLVKMFNEVG